MLLAMLSIFWQLIANDVPMEDVSFPVCETEWQITNPTSHPLPASGWEIRYCQLSVVPLPSDTLPLSFERVSASSHRIVPKSTFAPLAPGETRTYRVRYRGYILKENAAPEGAFLVVGDSCIALPIHVEPFSSPAQWSRGVQSNYTYADGEWLYRYYLPYSSPVEPSDAPFILPTPKYFSFSQSSPDEEALTHPEGFILDVQDGVAFTRWADEAGRFYAEELLRCLRTRYGNALPDMHICDWPDLPYRGLMLDIARNFTSLPNILRLMDYMAECRLNRLHLHLTDDEGWRIEIAGLPELTDIASKRGFTLDEKDCLLPYYGGGWDAQDRLNPANGYLTRKDFVRLLRYAESLHIQVIPEIDVPGHSRAAIVAMRHHPTLRLDDPLWDTVTYSSAQNYTDNILAIHLPSSYQFMERVIADIASMYQEAGVRPTYFHLGGDEVAGGVYSAEEQRQFVRSLVPVLAQYGFQPAGWEEAATTLPSEWPLCYCWRPSQAKALELADRRFPIVLSCADVLYFDHVFVRHHQETGLFWAGAFDYMDTYSFSPLRHTQVQGLQAQIFAETIRSFTMVERYLFPRIFALSERAWNGFSTPGIEEAQRWNDQMCRQLLPLLHKRGVHFHLSQPGVHLEGARIQMISSVPESIIRYTWDGSEPDEQSPVYTHPIPVQGNRLRARAFYLDERSATTEYLFPSPATPQP